jgi:L-threonylcarbamoyladenylate synthase
VRLDFRHPLAPPELAAIRAALARGGVLGIPTDTRYGLAADPFSAVGVERIFELKGRPASKAMPVVIAGLDQLERLGARLERRHRERLGSIWPAPLTVIVPVERAFPASGEGTVAVRVPDHAGLRDLLRQVGPLTATSANPSGAEPAGSADEVEAMFGSTLAFVLDAGPSPARGVSTLVDLSGASPRLVRPGPYSWSPTDWE